MAGCCGSTVPYRPSATTTRCFALDLGVQTTRQACQSRTTAGVGRGRSRVACHPRSGHLGVRPFTTVVVTVRGSGCRAAVSCLVVGICAARSAGRTGLRTRGTSPPTVATPLGPASLLVVVSGTGVVLQTLVRSSSSCVGARVICGCATARSTRTRPVSVTGSGAPRGSSGAICVVVACVVVFTVTYNSCRVRTVNSASTTVFVVMLGVGLALAPSWCRLDCGVRGGCATMVGAFVLV